MMLAWWRAVKQSCGEELGGYVLRRAQDGVCELRSLVWERGSLDVNAINV